MKRSRHIRAVLWDFDGTLVDSPAAVLAATNAALTGRGFQATDLERIKTGMVKATIPRMAWHAGIAVGDALAVALAEDFYRHAAAAFPAVARPFPGIAEVVRNFQARGMPQAVVTNNLGGMVRATLEACGLRTAMTAVLGDGDLPAAKPDPRGAWMAAAACAVAPGDCACIGDSAVDRDLARAAGMLAVGVAWGTTPADRLTGFDLVVERPEGLDALLR